MKLETIIKPIKDDLDNFDRFFRTQLQSKVPLLNMVLRYVASRGGKKMRPALIFLTAKLFGELNHRAIIGASMIELLHTATLVHDDVVDEAQERRGFLSINAIWKNKVAVLLGDYLLSRGLLVSVENQEFEFLRVTSNAVKKMSEGELQSMEATRRMNYSLDTYFEIIRNKTAVLLRSCCEIGAISQNQSKDVIQDIGLFGELLGIAFQIKDDILDYTTNSNILGKPVGNDIKEKKITLPLIFALENSTQNEVDVILKKMKNSKTAKKEVQNIIDFVKSKNGINFAEQKAKEFIDNALDIIKKYPDNEAKNSLINFSLYVLEREK